MKTVWILVLAALGAAAVPSNKPAELIKRAKLSLPEAAEKAAPEAKEGTPFSARLREEKGRLVYSIGFAQGEKSLRVLIDASTAEIVSKSTEAKSRAKMISGAKVAMPKLIEAAVAKVAGKATRISYELKKGKPFAEIVVVKDGKLFEVKVDATTGQVTKVEEDDDDDDEDDDDDDDDEDDDD
jgi:uncharacterized membrane protein YkoI